MLLPSRLGSSTLGDVLGTLHRARVTGIVELCETGAAGRRHRIALLEGLVTDVESDVPRADLLERLEALFSLSDATVRFHVARRKGGSRALAPGEFLHGRLRARDRRSGRAVTKSEASAEERAARALLGVSAAAREDDVRRAFRKLARDHHPDRMFGASVDELERAKVRLSGLSAAYHALMAAKANTTA